MANKLIYADEARRAILQAEPNLAYLIDRIKPVDAVEVVHGRWDAEYEYEDFRHAHCSVCGEVSEYMYKYCPNCGAICEVAKNEQKR